MEGKTWNISVKSAATQFTGQVNVSVLPGVQLTKQQIKLGQELAQLIETTARSYRAVDETQPIGKDADDVSGVAAFAIMMLRVLRQARSTEQTCTFAIFLVEACRAGLRDESRFAVAFSLATTVREKARNLERGEQLEDYLSEIERALPQPIRRGTRWSGPVVAVRYKEFEQTPVEGSKLVQMNTELHSTHVDSSELADEHFGGRTTVLPMPLYRLGEPGAQMLMTFFVGGAEYTVGLEGKRPVHGPLRAIGLALETFVEKRNAPTALDVYRTLAYARVLLQLANVDAYADNEYLAEAVDDALCECADTLWEAGEEFEDFHQAVVGADYWRAEELLPEDISERVDGNLSREQLEALNEAVVEATPGRTVVVFYNPGGDQHAELPTDWIPELEDFTPVAVPWLQAEHFASPSTQIFRTRF